MSYSLEVCARLFRSFRLEAGENRLSFNGAVCEAFAFLTLVEAESSVRRCDSRSFRSGDKRKRNSPGLTFLNRTMGRAHI